MAVGVVSLPSALVRRVTPAPQPLRRRAAAASGTPGGGGRGSPAAVAAATRPLQRRAALATTASAAAAATSERVETGCRDTTRIGGLLPLDHPEPTPAAAPGDPWEMVTRPASAKRLPPFPSPPLLRGVAAP